MSNPPISIEEIERRFGYHKPTTQGTAGTAPLHADLRRRFIDFAGMLNDVLPDGRAKSVAFTELESAAMWAHKAIASLDPVHREDPTPTEDEMLGSTNHLVPGPYEPRIGR